MKNLIKLLWTWKIHLMMRFSWGFGEFSNILALVRDVGTILLVFKFLFNIQFTMWFDLLIGLGSFMFFCLVGEILKKTGMLDYQTKLGNSINPEIKLISKIAEKLNVN